MKKIVFPLLLVTALILSACATSAAEPTAEPTVEPTTIPTTQEEPAEAGNAAPAIASASEENPCVPFNIIDSVLGANVDGLPSVTDDDWTKGPKDAPVTLIVYSDLLCSYCANSEVVFNQLLDLYPEDIRFVFRHWIIFTNESKTSNDLFAAQAAEAAGKQGKFFELADILFQSQSEWGSLDQQSFESWLSTKAESLGIDVDQFKTDAVSPEIVQKIEEAKLSGRQLGFGGTPTIVINGSLYEQQRDLATLSITTDLIKKSISHYAACPQMVIDTSKTYSATIETNKGDIKLELFDDSAPYAVNSFVFLANEGYYNDLPFITTEEFALSGDPSDTGYGGPGYAFKDEVSADYNFNEPGMLTTYALGPGLNGSSFLINKTPLEGQEGRTIFGRVTEGMDVLNSLVLRNDIFAPVEDTIIKITITES